MSDYEGFSSYSESVLDQPVSDGEKAVKKSRKSKAEQANNALDPFHPDYVATHDNVDNQLKMRIAAETKELRQYVLDVLAYSESVVEGASLPMDSIIALVDRFDLEHVGDKEIKSAVRSQLRAGMIERVGRSYRLASLGRATAEDMRGAFKNSFRR